MDGTMQTTTQETRGNRSERDNSVEPRMNEDDRRVDVDEEALCAADAFYNMFKSACHGITRRQELDQLYTATYSSFGSKPETRPEFSKVLFAMARNMKVLKVIRGGTISWNAFNRQDDRHEQRVPRDDRRPHYGDRREEREPRDDRRPHYGDRHEQREPRDDRRPHYGDRHEQREPRDDRRPHYGDRREQREPRDDRRPHYGDRREQREPRVRAHSVERD